MLNFTGNTRRQRQVNLSGKKPKAKPAPSSSQGSPAAVAAARESRALRESERQRNDAAVRIQSVFRGHVSRTTLRSDCRVAWDQSVNYREALALPRGERPPLSTEAIALLLLFYDTADAGDLDRLFFTISALRPDHAGCPIIDTALQSGGRSLFLLKRLFEKVVATLSRLSPNLGDPRVQAHTLLYLSFLSRVAVNLPETANAPYFTALRRIVQHDFLRYGIRSNGISSAGPIDVTVPLALLGAIILPLQSTKSKIASPIYLQFVRNFLAAPSLDTKLFSSISLGVFQRLLDISELMLAASKLHFNREEQDGGPWLLSYIISLGLHSDSAPSDTDRALEHPILSNPLYRHVYVGKPDSAPAFGPFIAAVSHILSVYGADATRWTNNTSKLPSSQPTKQISMKAKADVPDAFPVFIQEQLDQLLGTKFVQHLADLARVDQKTIAKSQELRSTRNATQSLSLHLLTSFKFLRQKFHNRLFLARSSDGVSLLPALFSQIQQTQTFQSGLTGTKDILNGLKVGRQNGDGYSADTSVVQEWSTIFLFLDVYSFANVVMDDKEFFSFEDKALNPKQLQLLVTFLKNLAFVTYFEVSEIEAQVVQEGSRFVATNTTDHIRTETRSNVAGVNGITLPWIRSLTVRILRSLHRRDSRHSFLPTDFWLMREVEVGASTTLIAEEEARQHSLEEMNDEDDSESDEDPDFQPAPAGQRGVSTKKQEKAIRHNYLAAITPRLEVLQNLPFFIPFRTRVSIFRDFVRHDQTRRGTSDAELWRLNHHHQNPFLNHHGGRSKHHGVIRRDRVFDDAYNEFFALGDGFKEPIQITFVDSFGAEEAGIDGGGILKEFLSSVVKESFRTDPTNGIPYFAETETHLLYPNPMLVDEVSLSLQQQQDILDYPTQAEISQEIGELLKQFEFLGRIIGKCMYEGILVDVGFADFFLLKWSKVLLGNDDVGLGVDDLKSFDYSLWKGLQALKHYDDQTLKDLDLTFTVENVLKIKNLVPNGPTQKVQVIELKPNGSRIPVTTANRLEYIHLLSRYKLVTQGKAQTNAFLRGLSSIIAPRWLSMFNQSELQTLVGGNESPLDIEDLRRNTIYGGVYVIGDDEREHPTIEMFWRVMRKFSEKDKRAVLKFVTSVSRAPLLGFGSLNPRFSIRDAGGDATRLPSTNYCQANMLRPPVWKIMSDRRGGRTAWSATVDIGGNTIQARYWYDGNYLANAKEDAAEVALEHMINKTVKR
ncbi:hypothetical protein Dda_0496 [Drechslerella dactyloides]|uniref:HECT-type E3 ubiquitin transferase n=1 Tax=Drechslerella dactyloides TaxID=74499 RepID=A0AAD6J5C2_DREDA|nr:hypothetical protein Dda_0496 [Drechslerella dactyloides]